MSEYHEVVLGVGEYFATHEDAFEFIEENLIGDLDKFTDDSDNLELESLLEKLDSGLKLECENAYSGEGWYVIYPFELDMTGNDKKIAELYARWLALFKVEPRIINDITTY
jgi:hypothetical protein